MADEQVTMGIDPAVSARIDRDEEWVEFVGGALDVVEVTAHGGTGDVGHQVLLAWEFRPEEMLPPPPDPVPTPDGKVRPEDIRRLNQWVASTHPVWTLKVLEQQWVETGAANTGGEGLGPPVLVVDLLERRLADLGRRLWLHPWYRRLAGLDTAPGEPGYDARYARTVARKRKQVEADLAAGRADWPRAGEAAARAN